MIKINESGDMFMDLKPFCASAPSDGKSWWLRLNKEETPKRFILTLLLDIPTNAILEQMSQVEKIAEHGEYMVFRGQFEGCEIGVLYHGSGSFSISTAIEELATLGVEIILRVGNSGGVSEQVKVGDTIVSIGAIREDRIMLDYIPVEYPAIADRKIVEAAAKACKSLGIANHEGLTLSVATFYPGSGFPTAIGVIDETVLQRVHLCKKVGALNMDIETSTVLTMAKLLKMRGGAVLGIGNHTVTGEGEFLEPEFTSRLALTGLKTLALLDE